MLFLLFCEFHGVTSRLGCIIDCVVCFIIAHRMGDSIEFQQPNLWIMVILSVMNLLINTQTRNRLSLLLPAFHHHQKNQLHQERMETQVTDTLNFESREELEDGAKQLNQEWRRVNLGLTEQLLDKTEGRGISGTSSAPSSSQFTCREALFDLEKRAARSFLRFFSSLSSSSFSDFQKVVVKKKH